MSTLYKWPITGNQQALLQLENDVKQNNLPNCYLFSGPAGIGKAKIALVLAQILQCENNFCQTCAICKKIIQSAHADTVMLNDDGNKVKIEEIRALIAKINMTTNSNYKVVYIQNIQRMTIEASNSFLKTLEEPPSNTIFIFTTNNWRNILPTIVSRTRLIKFKIPPINEIRESLINNFDSIDKDTIDKSLIYSLFKPESARELLNSKDDYNEARKFYLKTVQLLEKQDIYEGFKFIEENSKDIEKIKQFISYGIYILRSIVIKKIKENDGTANGLDDLINQIEYLEDARALINSNINVKLLLENFFIKIC